MITKSIRRFLTTFVIFSILSCSSDDNLPEDLVPGPQSSPKPIQESTSEFQKHYETKDSIFTLNSVVQLSDSSYTIAGAVRFNETGNKNLLMKFDKYGNRTWMKIMMDTYTPYGIQKLFQNGTGYIGYLGHHFDFDDSSHIIYFNSNGDVQDEIFINNDMLGNDMIRDGSNFLIAGRNHGMLFRLLDQNGELVWTKSYRFYPEAFSISKLEDGNFITIGGGNNTGVGDYLIKLSNTGEEIWSRKYNGLEVLALSNNAFLAVTTGEGANLVRFDETGNKVWNIPLENFGMNLNSPLNIFTYDKGFFVCTYINKRNNLNLLVFDQDGNIINLHTIDQIQGGNYTLVSKTLDGGLLIANSGNMSKFHILKLSSEFILNQDQL